MSQSNASPKAHPRFPSAIRQLLGLAPALLVALVACGDDPGVTRAPCGTVLCSDRQTCDDTVKKCVCLTNYAGEDCSQCADGYELTGTICAPKAIRCSEKPCKNGATCVRGGGNPDHCECKPGFSGPTCAQCAAGLQDNDGNGTCEPSCATAKLVCTGGLVCRDNVGAAKCACPVGTQGTDCRSCEAGYYRFGDAACVPSCSVVPSCGPRGHCFDPSSESGASCVCDVGYKGATCDACADGFTLKGKDCVPNLPTVGELLGFGKETGAPTLLAVTSATGATRPIRTLRVSADFDGVSSIARDRVTDRTFVAHAERPAKGNATFPISLLDMNTGVLTPTLPNASVTQPTYVPGDDAFYGPGVSAIFKLPISGAATSLGPYGLTPGAGTRMFGLAWDAALSKLFAVGEEHQKNGVHLFEVNRTTGALSQTAMLLADSPTFTFASPAIVGDSVFMLHRATLTPAQDLELRCREGARRLGYAGALTAPYSEVPTAYKIPVGTITLSSKAPSGPELIAFGGHTGGPATLEVATQNPDAFFCILTFEGQLLIKVNPTAKFKGGMLFSYRNTLSADATGFPIGGAPSIHTQVTVAAAGADLSKPEVLNATFAQFPGVFRIYSRPEWKDRRLEEVESSDSLYLRSREPAVLTEISTAGVARGERAVQGDLSFITPW